MKYTRSEILRRLKDVPRKGWTNHQIRDLIDSLWREPFINRTSGFDQAGGPDSVIDFDNTTRTFSISPAASRFAFWQFIVRIAFFKRTEGMTIQIPDEEGRYLFYIFRDEEDTSFTRQQLFFIKNPVYDEIKEVYTNRIVVAWVYWNSQVQEALYFGDSRHGSLWNPQIHWWAHNALNTLRQSGINLVDIIYDGDGSLDAHYQFGISEGTLWHEDIFTGLSAVGKLQSLPVWYFDEEGYPRFLEQNGKKFLNTGSGRVAYNDDGIVTEASEGWFVVYHLFATNCKLHSHISVMGSNQFETLPATVVAIEPEIIEAIKLLPHSNLLHIASIVLQTSSGYANTAKARIVTAVEGIKTDMSVTGDGTPVNPVTLINDQENPGEFKYYGTNENEIKGYHVLPGAGKIVNQPEHDFVLYDVIRHNGTAFVEAQADNAVNAAAVGIVTKIIDVNHFIYASEGTFQAAWVTPGAEYFLSPDSPGQIITLPEPEVWNIGQVRLFLGWGTPEGFKIEIDTGDEIGMFDVAVSSEKSVTGDGKGNNKLRLVNDETAPLEWNFYGTNGNREKGFHKLPEESVQLLESPAAVFDMEFGRGATITLTADTVITFFNLKSNDTGHIEVIQDAVGGWDLSFGGVPVEIADNSYKAPATVKLTGIAESKDVVAWWYTGTVIKLAVIYNTLS